MLQQVPSEQSNQFETLNFRALIDEKQLNDYEASLRQWLANGTDSTSTEELTQQKQEIDALPPRLKEFLFNQNSPETITSQDYSTVLRIAQKLSTLEI